MLINVETHSPFHFRVNGPLANFEPFYTAFNVKKGDKMYLDTASRAGILVKINRCRVLKPRQGFIHLRRQIRVISLENGVLQN